ncbi:cation:proton antiporter domain-containing protein [Sanguibacter suaedae]|uniref:Cation:proton antiporter n=1 Tax=Sanguibacter suaedae TaxID=2795737 RepID=A0A934IA70_9MICO|nr:cation:proton antiporter [Sanguibacter suaedae]MBI9115922.1 cation:proton antiporter [Sanguibacter suaedae]
MNDLHLLYACVGVVAVALALVSRSIRELPVSEPLVALAVGVVLGPAALGLLDLDDHNRDLVLLEGSRLLLAGSVMAAALRFPVHDLRRIVRPVLVLLCVVMPLSVALGAAAGLLLGLPLGLALLLGACLCPTDPVLAASVVTGEPAERDLPTRLRQMLTAESGANDGLALPVVGVALAVVLPTTGPGDVAGRLVWEVLGAVLVGAALGVLAGWALQRATRDRDLEKGPELVLTLLLAVATLGVGRLAGTAEVLAVLVAGLAYNAVVGDGERVAQDDIDEAINRYAVLPLLLVLGAVLPWSDWGALGPAAVLFVVLVLGVRRLPVVLALARPLGLRLRDATFVGWFGPMGVSAVFYLAHSAHEGADDPRLFAAGTLAVAASVVAFGLTGTPGRRAYARAAAR